MYELSSIRIIKSDLCYITKTITYGIADKRRPNGKKPLYRKKTIHIPTAYMVGRDLICHPDYYQALKDKYWVIEQDNIIKQIASVSGIPSKLLKL